MNKNKAGSYQINTLFSRSQILILCNCKIKSHTKTVFTREVACTGELSDSASEIEILNPALFIEFNIL